MRINHNISALNTYRQMSVNSSATSSSMEKLSSGLRINRAGDDAAGLAISEKMRAQIRGLDQASTNAQDGISLIQTAEGALNETHSILQRMRELAVQSANDTNTDEDRAELQKEVDQLAQEITRISEDTEFNTKTLLDGSVENLTFHIGSNEGQNISIEIGDMGSAALKVAGVEAAGEDTEFDTDITINNSTLDDYTIKYATLGTDTVTETTAEVDKESKTITITLKQDDKGAVEATKQEVVDALNGTGIVSATVKAGKDAEKATAGQSATATAGTASTTKGIDISSQESASAAITVINDAIQSVSAQRSNLGAVQNRLEHTINNLETSSENLTAAESRIRDVDMAKEMMEMTKNNILQQAAQSMLAQANQQPQGVLQLLQ